ncbi:hypothetical protein BV898_16550 [Hypsibius exemplaris]|uniref:Uncharacterized protein n=1 Tax=Hypsibius exemplaris TaxID=2072580 RepID=A0A9X6RLQ7_HYPEX|nr:hypothetical protein BV898_16550 [Hypsibius exemplaris]
MLHGSLRRNSRLVTPFSIHIVNMLVINLTGTATYDVILHVRNLNRDIFRGSYALCGAYKYFQWTSRSLPALQHSINCWDRWLAFISPNSYRTKTIRFGIISAVTIVVYQHLW